MTPTKKLKRDDEVLIADRFTPEDFDEIIDQVRTLREKKAKQYESKKISVHDYFCHGKKSYDQMLWVKVLREIQRKESSSNLDSLFDLLNYTVFAIDFHQKTNPNWFSEGIRDE